MLEGYTLLKIMLAFDLPTRWCTSAYIEKTMYFIVTSNI